MSNQLNLQVKLAAIDKMSAPIKAVAENVRKLSQNIVLLEEEKKKLQNQQKLIESFSKLKNSVKESSQKLQEAQSKAQALASQLNATSKPTKKMQQDFERARKAVVRLKTEQQNHLVKLQRTRQALQESGIKTKSLGAAQAALSQNLSLTNENIDRQKRALHQLNQIKSVKPAPSQPSATSEQVYRERVGKLKETSERFAHFGQRSLIVGAATTGLLAKPTQEFAAAENAATQLKVAMMDNTGKVSDNFEKINKLATDLGNRLPGTTADFQNLMTMLVRQGMSAETILGGTGEAAAYLSVQLGMAPEKAAEFAAKMQDSTRSMETDMMSLMDLIQKGFYAGVDPTNMLGSYKNLSAAMDVIKMKGIEGAKALAPFVAQLDQAGMDGSAAGNALRKIFAKGMDTTKISKELAGLKKEGLIGKNFKLDFTDGKGEFGGLPKMFKELDKLKTLSTEARLQVIKSVFGDDAEVNQALTNLIEKGQAGYDEFAAKMEKQASLQQRVNAQLQTLTNIWDSASGTFTNLLASIGETLAPQLKALAEGFGEVAEKIMIWVKANPELAGAIVKGVALFGSLMVVLGGTSLALSYIFYPIGRAALAFGKLSEKMGESTKGIRKTLRALSSWKTGGSIFKNWLGILGRAVQSFGMGIVRVISFLWNPLKWFRAAVVLVKGLGAVLALIASPLGILAASFIGAGIAIYKNWERVKAFFGGFWQGLKEGLAPVIEKFKPLGDLLGMVVGWVEKAWKWFTDLLTPVETTQKGLDEAASAGKKFGEWLAAGIDLVTKPLQWLMDAIAWVKGQMPEMEESAKRVNGNIAASATKATEIATMIVPPQVQTQAKTVQDKTIPSKGHARGGFTGAGGKYDPAGIVHRGEYVMTKEATARLGVANLNRLNYGGVGGLAAVAAMASGVALAQPMAVKVDNRPLLSAPAPKAASGGLSQNISITINASPNQSEREIARLVQQELVKAQHQAQARNRSSLRDRG